MSLELRQQLKLTQQLVMTPQLQQAIKLLQLSRMELVDVVRKELLENPVLEDGNEVGAEPDSSRDPEPPEASGVDAPDREAAPKAPEEADPGVKEVSGDESTVNEVDWDAYLENYSASAPMPSTRVRDEEGPSFEATVSKKPSLTDHLMWQLQMSNMEGWEERVGTLIIGNIDPNGYFREPSLMEIAEQAQVNIEQAEAVLRRIQEFDPVGVAARDLSECLLIQARHLGEDTDVLVAMLTDHMAELEKHDYQAIAKALHQPIEEIYETAKVILSLDPKPGRQYSADDPHYITPDVYVHKVAGDYFVVSNDDGLPKLRISNYYRAAMAQGGEQARQYIQQKLRSAQWLIRSIQQRQRTIIRVTESIVKFQREFFDKGIAYLRPMVLRDVADDVGMHESTISRVTTNKYVHTPQGIFELKYFFNSGIQKSDGQEVASETVKQKIKEIIASEDSKKPYSDQKIVAILREQGIEIARRTVAKYREQLGILSSSKRRRYF